VTWLDDLRRIRAIAQAGRAYSKDPYDLDRFVELGTIAEELIARLAELPVARVRDLFVPERGYPTPKVDVRAGVFRDDSVLMVREAADSLWSLPGGWADEQESPSAAAVREVREESGYDVRVVKLVALKDRSLHPYTPPRLEHIYKLFFLCELVGGEWQARVESQVGGETTAAGFFAREALPPLSMGRTLASDIEMLHAHRLAPAAPTQFD